MRPSSLLALLPFLFSQISALKKMSSDPGEKFYLEYWLFEEQELVMNNMWTNTSDLHVYEAPFQFHSTRSSQLRPRFLPVSWPARFSFHKRDFQCPSGTSSCASINKPDICCQTGYTCELIQDTGVGDVGCCPPGQTCGGTVSYCDAGYTSCPTDQGGGCCLPGYACYGEGCIQESTATVSGSAPSQSSPNSSPTIVAYGSTTTVTSTVIVTPPASGIVHTSTTTVTPSSIITSTSVSIVPPPTTQISTQISVVTTTITTTQTISDTATCSAGSQTCASSLGGGCCPSSLVCGTRTCIDTNTPSPSSSASATFIPPARPTTAVTTTTTTSLTTSSTYSGCPTGFYGCSAVHQGGCCQTDRSCDTYSCPATVSTTLVSGASLTIVAPTGSGITAPGTVLTGSCATGWSTCPASVNGGCCLSGYACGTAACSPTGSASAGPSIGKEAPVGAAERIHVVPLQFTLITAISCIAIGYRLFV